MEAGGLVPPPFDWTAPWIVPLAHLRPLVEVADWPASISARAGELGVTSAAGRPLQFVGADDAAGAPYEAHIAATGRVPTRNGAGAIHDLFNALMWLHMPRTKAALNQRQAIEIERDGVGPRRGRVRDAATLIDESGLLLCCANGGLAKAMAAALARHDWAWLFISQRERWGRDCAAFVFGHALLEKLLCPYKRLTAAVVLLQVPAFDRAEIDAAAAHFVLRAELAPSLLQHLPVLGIPGWCADNEVADFYDDAEVFRPAPRARGADPVERKELA